MTLSWNTQSDGNRQTSHTASLHHPPKKHLSTFRVTITYNVNGRERVERIWNKIRPVGEIIIQEGFLEEVDSWLSL